METDENSKKELDRTPFYIPYNETYGRKKTATGVIEEKNATLKRYYSPIDAEIYFGDHFVEDVVDITFNINQQSAPIYGYNSYTPDEIAVGSRLIQGQFTINFTSPRYLFNLLAKAKQSSTLPTDTGTYHLSAHERNNLLPKGDVDKTLSGEQAFDNRQEMWPETFDIDIVYGSKTPQTPAVHLVLEGVRLITCTQGASAHANVPATENYTFVAKDYKVLA